MADSSNPESSLILRWIEDHLDYPHRDYCLIWPFGIRAGYGLMALDGQNLSAHRYICERKNGPAPSADHVAAHSCFRGHDACVNHHHLSWKTHSENQLDRTDGIGRRKRSKVTIEIAREIRCCAGQESTSSIAKRYGISQSAVRQILSGKTWREDDRSRPFDLTAEQAAAVFELKGKKTQMEIAREFGISHAVVWRIHHGLSYGHAIKMQQTIG